MSGSETTATTLVETEEDAGPGLDIGGQIGRYRIRSLVGAGGVGMVFAADDIELGRAVAIKLLAREHDDARTRLLREAQAMARLSHPNVVTVHEVLHIGERTAIVMELVAGQDLSTWIEERPRPWREVVSVYVQAARGLAAAHRAGLVHRDFKPSNALIDRDGVVRVTDFGLVRATGGDDRVQLDPRHDLELTSTNMLLGTPAYMAPEQHRQAPVDARTDQWALACSLYGALYGQRPFAGDTVTALAAAVNVGAIRPEPNDSPVPRRIRGAIRKGLSRRPDERYDTMEALIAALTPPPRPWLPLALGGAAVAAAVAVVVTTRDQGAATCAGLDRPFAASWSRARADALRARFADAGPVATATVERVIAGLDRYRDDWVDARGRACADGAQGVGSADLLDRRMRCLDRYLVEVDTVIDAALDADARALGDVGAAIDRLHPVGDCDDPGDTVPRPGDPELRAAIAGAEEDVARAWALAELGQFDTGRPLAERAVEVAERTGWTPLIARANLQRGRSQSRAYEGGPALASFDRAARAAAEAGDDRLVAEALVARFYTLADSLGRARDALAGRDYVELALVRAGDPPRVRANWLHHLAIALYFEHRFDEALEIEEASGAILREVVAPGNVALIDHTSVVAAIEIERGQLDRAQALLEEVMAYDVAQRGEDHPQVADSLANLAALDIKRGDLQAALARYDRALAIDVAAGLSNHYRTLDAGLVRFELGRWAASIDLLTSSLAQAEASAPGDSTIVAEAATWLGAALTAVGELDRAAPVLERALAAARGSSAPGLPATLGHAAILAVARGALDDARALLDEARTAAGDPAPSVPIAEGELALAVGDCAAARAAFARALAMAAKPPQAWAITAATVGAAGCGDGAAIAPLQARLDWLERGGAEPAALARGRLLLARGAR